MPTSDGECHEWHPYNGVPGVVVISNGAYEHRPLWFRQFLFEQEAERGLDCTEDLASPGALHFDLSGQEAVLVLSTDTPSGIQRRGQETAVLLASRLASAERLRRALFPSRLHHSASAYLVRRGAGKTVIAGYPWFTDWGRDTFIALRGLCLATGRLDDAEQILVDWAGTVSEGMIPNRFPDHGEAPEFNSVDASLWYVVAVYEFLQAAESTRRRLPSATSATLENAIDQILAGYCSGTRFGIRADNDSLLRAGVPGVQLTRMDAKVGDWVVTPRTGKPVEVQALWLNALWIGGQRSAQWQTLYERGRVVFQERFWNAGDRGLYDIIGVDHEPGRTDVSVRPNQILAVGGLPLTLLDRMEAGRVVEVVEQQLWTPLGLRSLAPGSPGYAPRYEGGVWQRDGAYHQGTVWPWLIGPFVEGWLRVHGTTAERIADAKRRFIEPLLDHLEEAGLGHISEIVDAEAPYTPRGCPFHAWSLGELLRLQSMMRVEAREADPANALTDDFISIPPRASGHAAIHPPG